MKTILSTLLLSILALGPLAAQSSAQAEATKVELARELMVLMQVDAMIDQQLDQVRQFTRQQMMGQGLSQQEQAMAMESMDAVWEEMDFSRLTSSMAEVYAQVLTEKELQGFIDFFSSDIGQSFVRKQPQLTAAAMQVMQREMGSLMPRIQARMQEIEAKYEDQ